MSDAIMLRLPNRLIEAATAGCRGDHVPEANSSLGETLQPPLIVELGQPLADRQSEQAPELVSWVGVVATCCERSVAREAAEQEQPCVASSNRRQSGFDAHHLIPTAAAREHERPSRRPLLGQLQLCPRRRQPGAQPAGRLSAEA